MDGGMAIKEGILRAMPDAQVTVMPLADGGEGTTEALTRGLGGRQISVAVTDPAGMPVTASYGYLEESRTAVMEMAAAAGITLVTKYPAAQPGQIRQNHEPPAHPAGYSVMQATTRGVGEMILDALNRGCKTFLIGIGGSATNDGGIGMLKALGFRFTDNQGQDAGEGAQALGKICRIECGNADPRLAVPHRLRRNKSTVRFKRSHLYFRPAKRRNGRTERTHRPGHVPFRRRDRHDA